MSLPPQAPLPRRSLPRRGQDLAGTPGRPVGGDRGCFDFRTPAADDTARETAGDKHNNCETHPDSVRKHVRSHHAERMESDRVSVGHDVLVEKDEKAVQAVAVFGDATVDGEATDQAVSVWAARRSMERWAIRRSQFWAIPRSMGRSETRQWPSEATW